MDGEISVKAQELLDTCKKTESSWTADLNQKNEFIRRRDHTIFQQTQTINTISKEVQELIQKNEKLADLRKKLTTKLNKKQADQQKLTTEKLALGKMYLEAQKNSSAWKTKYINLKSEWREQCKSRVDTFSDNETSGIQNVQCSKETNSTNLKTFVLTHMDMYLLYLANSKQKKSN